MSRHITMALAEAVAQFINSKDDWSIPITAVSKWVPTVKAATCDGIELVVVPVRMRDQQILDRRRGEEQKVSETHIVGICLQSPVDDINDDEQINLWANALQEVSDWMRQEKRGFETDLFKANYLTCEMTVFGESLRQQSRFNGYAFPEYRVTR